MEQEDAVDVKVNEEEKTEVEADNTEEKKEEKKEEEPKSILKVS